MDKNQIVIQKVSNGFIGTLQSKGGSSLFGETQVDKEHFIFKNTKELSKWVVQESKLLSDDINNEKIEEDEDEEDENN